MRYVIIGCAASIVPTHLKAFAQLSGAQIVGMADISAERGAVTLPLDRAAYSELLASLRQGDRDKVSG